MFKSGCRVHHTITGEPGTVLGVRQKSGQNIYAVEWDESACDECHAYYYEYELTAAEKVEEDFCAAEEKKKDIRVFRSAHGTCDIVVYNKEKHLGLVDFFGRFDIWGSHGYDRFNDGGVYFEVPAFMYEIIDEIPYIPRNNLKIEKL